MALPITITDAGRAEIINAQNTGTGPVTITEIGFGTGQYTPTKIRTALQAQIKRVSSIAGQAVAADTIHVMALDESSAAYNVGEFGLFSDKGTLIAVYSQPAASGWIIQKAGPSTLLLATDIILESLNATSITFGDISFINPPATTSVQGVVELATPEETQAGTDGARAVTPAGLKSLTANTSRAGLVQLNNTLTSSSASQALTAAQGKKLQDEKLPISRVQTSATDSTADALLTVGAFGLGASSAPSEATDCNNLTRPGFYSVGGSAANRPAYVGGVLSGLLVLAGGSSSRCSQMHFLETSSAVRVSVRHLTNSGWGTWQELYHAGNLSPVETSRQLNAGNGLTGGGTLAADRTITLGTPSKVSKNSSNSVGADTHSHELELPAASASEAGIVQLNNTLTSSSTSQALTAAQGKKLQDEKLPISRVQSSATDATADALLTVGAFGLGASSAPSEATDCNNLTRPGFYSVGGSAANRPAYAGVSASGLQVLPGGTSARCSQMHFLETSSTVRVSVRHLTSSGWGSWQELYHAGNLNPVETSRQLNAGNGLTGGGTLAADRTITLGTPSKVSKNSSNSVGADTHSHELELPAASESEPGIVQLNNTLTSTSTSQALTAAQGKKLQDEKLPISRVQTSATDSTANALLTVGAFGLGASSAPSEAGDCNNLIRPGFYSVGGSAANRPAYVGAVASGLLVVAGGTAARCSQLHFMDSSSTARLSVRHLTSSGWTAWRELYHDGNMPAASTGQAGIVQLNDTVTSTSTIQAATPNAVKAANDNANTRAPASRQVSAGNGLSGGGTLGADRTISLGTPSRLTSSTPNAATANSHTHELDISGFFRNIGSSNDWDMLPNGRITQWFSATVVSGGDVLFPIEFPNEAWSIIPVQGNTATLAISCGINNVTRTGFKLYHSGGGTAYSFRFIAVGK